MMSGFFCLKLVTKIKITGFLSVSWYHISVDDFRVKMLGQWSMDQIAGPAPPPPPPPPRPRSSTGPSHPRILFKSVGPVFLSVLLNCFKALKSVLSNLVQFGSHQADDGPVR